MNGKEKLKPLFEIANNDDEDQKIIVNPYAGKKYGVREKKNQPLIPLCRRATQEERNCAIAGWKIPGDSESIQKSTPSPASISTQKAETAKVLMPKSSDKSRVVRESCTVESERLVKEATKSQEVVEPQEERTIFVSAKPHGGTMADTRNGSGWKPSLLKSERCAVDEYHDSQGWELAYKLNQENIILKQKRRRKMRSFEIVESLDLGLGLLKNFDDGTHEIEHMSNDFGGESFVYQIVFPQESKLRTLWAIKARRGFVLGVLDQLNEKKIYENFRKCGVSFSHAIAENIIRKALFARYFGEIMNTSNVCKVEYLPGWEFKKENSAMIFNEGIRSRFRPDLVDFQDLEFKRIDIWEGNVEVLEKYSHMLANIWDDGLRISLQHLSFLGLLHSLFEMENLYFGRIVNFIFVEDFSKVPVVERFLQIYNRNENFATLDISNTNKGSLSKKIGQARDEILAVRAVKTGDTTYYQKEKAEGYLQWIQALVSGNAILNEPYNRKPKCDFCFFSGNRVPDTVSVYVSNQDLELLENILNLQESDEIGIVNSMFLTYVSENQEIVRPIIKKARFHNCLEVGIMESVNEILQKFYTNYHINCQSLDADRKFFEDFIEEESTDILVVFMNQLFDYAKNLYFHEKNINFFNEHTIFFDDENFWMTEEVFEEILSGNWLGDYKKQILVNLKSDNILVTDSSGFKRRVTISGERREAYQLNREIITEGYGVDITILGREEF